MIFVLALYTVLYNNQNKWAGLWIHSLQFVDLLTEFTGLLKIPNYERWTISSIFLMVVDSRYVPDQTFQ